MPHFFTNKRLIILLGSIILLVALIGFSVRDRENITWPEKFVKDVTGFGQNLVSKPAGAVEDFWGNVQRLRYTYEENEELRARLATLAQLESDVASLEKDNTELREVLGKQDSLADYEPVQATVIARNPDRWYELITIDQGESNGIEVDMAVMTARGLVGKVQSTSKFTSTVQLLSSYDAQNRVSAFVQGETPVYGLIEGYDEEKQLLKLTKIPSGSKVEKGQSVITSGMGGVFPKGLVVGEVMELVPDEFGLTLTALIKPAASFYDLEHVMVAKRAMPSVLPEEQNRQQVLIEEEEM